MSPQTRFYDKNYIYSITVTTYERFPYFKESILCDLWIEELQFCKELKNFKLFAFCLLPNHFHLLIQPSEKENISEIMKFFKENLSRDINRIIAGETAPSRLRLSGVINKFNIEFHQKHPQNTFPPFRWQKSFHDHVIRCDRDIHHHHNYIENNFLKHDVPHNWKYSSLYFPELIDIL